MKPQIHADEHRFLELGKKLLSAFIRENLRLKIFDGNFSDIPDR